VHLILQVEIVFERLTIFSGDRRESFDPIISNCLLVLILVAQRGLTHIIGDHVYICGQVDLVLCILEAIAAARGLAQHVDSRSGSARGRAGIRLAELVMHKLLLSAMHYCLSVVVADCRTGRLTAVLR